MKHKHIISIRKMVILALDTIIVCSLLFFVTNIVEYYFDLAKLGDIEEANLLKAQEMYEEPTCEVDQIKSNYDPSITEFSGNENELIGYLEIPDLDISTGLILGSTDDAEELALDLGSSVSPTSNYPRTGGSVVVAGHRHLEFSKLENVQVGQEIIVNIDGNIYTYKVTGTDVITPDQTDKVFSDSDQPERLVLYTCYPFSYWAATDHRFVVYADPVDSISADC